MREMLGNTLWGLGLKKNDNHYFTSGLKSFIIKEYHYTLSIYC